MPARSRAPIAVGALPEAPFVKSDVATAQLKKKGPEESFAFGGELVVESETETEFANKHSSMVDLLTHVINCGFEAPILVDFQICFE